MIMTVEAFEDKFFKDGYPYWKAFEGKSTGKSAFAQNSSLENMDESWQRLKDTVFETCDGGTATILTRSSWHAKDGLVVTVTWGNSTPSIGGMHPANQSGFNTGGIAGLQQIMGFAQDIMKQQMQPLIDGIQKSFEIERLKDKITYLEEAEAPTTKDMVIEGITSRLPQLIDTFLGRRSSAPAIGVLGGQAERPIQGNDDDEEEQPMKQHTMDLNAVVNSAQVLQQVFPQYNVSELLMNLAKYCQSNPSQAEMVIKMIMKP